MVEDGPYLLARDAWEPLQEIVHGSIVLEILEERGHRHARAAKQPSTAVAIGIAFDRRAGGPANHAWKLTRDPQLRSALRPDVA